MSPGSAGAAAGCMLPDGDPEIHAPCGPPAHGGNSSSPVGSTWATWFTLGGAMALARADASVDITLDPTVMANGNGHGTPAHLGKGQVRQPWARGSFARRGGRAVDGQRPAAPPEGGRIWICKLGWWDGAPWDVRAYAAGHPAYPCDSTLQNCMTAPSSRPTRNPVSGR